ncbi:12790_t:CDS:2, partial [Acaulospora colombiana]
SNFPEKKRNHNIFPHKRRSCLGLPKANPGMIRGGRARAAKVQFQQGSFGRAVIKMKRLGLKQKEMEEKPSSLSNTDFALLPPTRVRTPLYPFASEGRIIGCYISDAEACAREPSGATVRPGKAAIVTKKKMLLTRILERRRFHEAVWAILFTLVKGTVSPAVEWGRGKQDTHAALLALSIGPPSTPPI